jgi:molybdate transport system substrate-binding protein
MLKRFLIAIILLSHTILVSSEIRVAVAANVSYAIHPLIKEFNKTHPTTKVHVILGSSGKLFAQISHGAPYDLFMSANMKYPNRLYEDNLTTDKPIIYAQGALALLSSKASNFDAGLNILTEKNIKKIAVANPKTAPYGVATQEALQHAKLYDTIKEKFVYGESISQTVTYAISAADIGIVAKSSLFAPQMSAYTKGIHWVDVDEALYTPIDQGMVLLKKSERKDEAKAFYDFMQSKKAKKILTSFGYKVP